MIKTMKKLLLVSAALSAVGCSAGFNGAEHALTVAEEHPISVDSQTVTMTLDPASGELSSLDKARIRAFANSYMRNGHGALALTSTSGGDAVRQALHDAGVPQASMTDASYRGAEGASGAIILSYTHYVATPSVCGVWDGARERDYRNMRSPNFGCATQNNLAAMIGDPRELSEPADMTDPDSATRIRGVAAFRAGKVTSSATDSEVDAQVASQ